MASVIYPKAKEALLQAGINLATDTIKAALIDTGVYTYSAAHQYWSSASAAAVGTTQTLASKTITDGIFDAADAAFSAVSGNSIEAIIIYKDTGTPATSPLIAYIDAGTGLPITPNGGAINVTWDNGASRIFAL